MPQPLQIAYADDHHLVRKGIIGLLEAIGNTEILIETGSGEELIAALEAAPTLPQICILDISMPGMNGFEVIAELRERWPKLRVLVLTVFAQESYVIRMIRSGANGYLSKSCSAEEMQLALNRIMEKGMYYSELMPQSLINAVHKDIVRAPSLTPKERELLKHVVSDLTYAEIATQMQTTPRSVEGYRDSLFRKLKVNSRVALALYAVQSGEVPMQFAGA
jgi:two-component system invasion response regulator UvrY